MNSFFSWEVQMSVITSTSICFFVFFFKISTREQRAQSVYDYICLAEWIGIGHALYNTTHININWRVGTKWFRIVLAVTEVHDEQMRAASTGTSSPARRTRSPAPPDAVQGPRNILIQGRLRYPALVSFLDRYYLSLSCFNNLKKCIDFDGENCSKCYSECILNPFCCV